MHFRDKFLATWVAELMKSMTGDNTRVIGVRTQWKVERYTGTDWVEG